MAIYVDSLLKGSGVSVRVGQWLQNKIATYVLALDVLTSFANQPIRSNASSHHRQELAVGREQANDQ